MIVQVSFVAEVHVLRQHHQRFWTSASLLQHSYTSHLQHIILHASKDLPTTIHQALEFIVYVIVLPLYNVIPCMWSMHELTTELHVIAFPQCMHAASH